MKRFVLRFVIVGVVGIAAGVAATLLIVFVWRVFPAVRTSVAFFGKLVWWPADHWTDPERTGRGYRNAIEYLLILLVYWVLIAEFCYWILTLMDRLLGRER